MATWIGWGCTPELQRVGSAVGQVCLNLEILAGGKRMMRCEALRTSAGSGDLNLPEELEPLGRDVALLGLRGGVGWGGEGGGGGGGGGVGWSICQKDPLPHPWSFSHFLRTSQWSNF